MSSSERASLHAFRRRQEELLSRLERVNRALARWDEYEAAVLVPEDLRPQVTPPSLGREALGEVRQTLMEVIGELEGVWERRN